MTDVAPVYRAGPAHPRLADEFRCSQVALSTIDQARTARWYVGGLGYRRSGSEEFPPEAGVADLQGLPESEARIEWLLDSQEMSQLELFAFRRPRVRLRGSERRPNDIGYSVVTFQVDDLDVTLNRLNALGSNPLTQPLGATGERRVCVRDPEGVLVELMEGEFQRRPLALRRGAELSVAARGIRASVPDLERSLHFFADVLGMERSPRPLHESAHEALWGLDGAEVSTATLWAGNFAIELAQYIEPPGRPWPDGYMISDQGIVNIAIFTRSREAYREKMAAVAEAGFSLNREMNVEHASINYVMDDQGFSVEILYLAPAGDRAAGYLPAGEE